MTHKPQTNEQLFRRLENKIQINDNLCWIWKGNKDKDGYGLISYQKTPTLRTTKRTHRITYEHYFGPIPKNLQTDHLCRNTTCCNPRHLEAVTCKENIRRGNTGKHRTPQQMRQLAINYWAKQPPHSTARRQAGERLLKHHYSLTATAPTAQKPPSHRHQKPSGTPDDNTAPCVHPSVADVPGGG